MVKMPKAGEKADTSETEQGVAGDLTHDRSNSRAGFAADTLLSFVERIERLTEEAEGIAGDRKEVYAEAKGSGFDTKILKRCIALRKLDKDELHEMDALMDLYRTALEKAEKARYKASVDAGE